MVHGGQFAIQLLRMVLGFIAAVLAAGLFLSWGIFQGAGSETDPIAFAAVIGTGMVTASVVGAIALMPAIFAIGLAETFGWRGFVYHMAAAGLIALLLWTVNGETSSSGPRPGTAIALAAGFLAGGVYWLVAGRCSGLWRVKMGKRKDSDTAV